MKENLYCSSHKSGNQKFRDGWDQTFKKNKSSPNINTILTCVLCGNNVPSSKWEEHKAECHSKYPLYQMFDRPLLSDGHESIS